MAVRCGSFVRAADELGITPAAVGQRVKALEDYLGVALLLRTRGGIRPAPELETALAALTRAFADLEQGVQQLEAQRGKDIHIAAPSDVVDLWLMPRLEQFRASHRNMRFCINGEGDAPLRIGKVDVELGFDLVPNSDVEPLFHDVIVVLASPLNIVRLATCDPETRLEGFPLLHLDLYRNEPAGVSWPDWVRWNNVNRTAPERGMRFQRAAAALDAVAADAGLTLCGMALAACALAEQRVALAWPVSTGLRCRNALSVRCSSQAAPHVKRFRAWLLEEGAKTKAWIAAQIRSGTDTPARAPAPSR